MTKRRQQKLPTTPDGWTVETEIKINGRYLRPGTEFKVAGQSGRFRFTRQVTTPTSTWIDARTSDGRFKSFSPERVKTVHAKTRLRGAAA